MALIDELKEQREQSHKLMHEHQRNAFEWQINADIEAQRTRDLDRAIAALEAPAQPVHPDELRSVPEQDAEVDPDFIAWAGGECPFDADVVVDVVLGSGSVIKYNRADFWQRGSWLHEPGYVHIVAYRLSQNVLPGGIEESRDHLIDAQTSEEVDPRVSWKADNPAINPVIAENEAYLAETEIPEGFTRWEEGMQPPPADATVDVIYRNGERPYKLIGAMAYALDWTGTGWLPGGDNWDIIAYRIIEATASEQDDGESEEAYEREMADFADEEDDPASIVSTLKGGPEPEQPASVEIEPSPYAEAIEKGAITQDEADFLISERERIAAAEQAKFFGQGVMADADRHAQERSMMEKAGEALAAIFKREREDA